MAVSRTALSPSYTSHKKEDRMEREGKKETMGGRVMEERRKGAKETKIEVELQLVITYGLLLG
jgi:hypothetical protein